MSYKLCLCLYVLPHLQENLVGVVSINVSILDGLTYLGLAKETGFCVNMTCYGRIKTESF